MFFPHRKFWPGLTLGLSLLSTPSAFAQDATRDPAELFKSLDKNGDGVIKADEVEGEQKRHFERLLRIADKDKNGELSREEFTAGVRPEERPAGGGERPAGDRPAFDGGRMFERLDANKDGKITLDEVPEDAKERVRPILERLGKESLTREEFLRAVASLRPMGEGANARPDGRRAEEFFSRLDANGDGRITVEEAPEQGKRVVEGLLRRLNRGANDGVTREEFVKLMSEGRPGEGRPGERPPEGRPPEGQPGERRPQLPRLFERLDANHDGRITKEELAKAAEQFDAMDENKDGQLDPRELLGPPPGERRPEGRPENRPTGERPAGERPPEGRPPEGRRPEGNPDNRRPDPNRMVDEVFSRQDVNNDGKISKDEARAMLSENFDRLDADKDGFVTKDELRKAMADRLRNIGNRPEGRRPEGRPPEGERKPE